MKYIILILTFFTISTMANDWNYFEHGNTKIQNIISESPESKIGLKTYKNEIYLKLVGIYGENVIVTSYIYLSKLELKLLIYKSDAVESDDGLSFKGKYMYEQILICKMESGDTIFKTVNTLIKEGIDVIVPNYRIILVKK